MQFVLLFASSCILAQTVALIPFPCFFSYLPFLCVVFSCLTFRHPQCPLQEALEEGTADAETLSKTRQQYTGKTGKRRNKENLFIYFFLCSNSNSSSSSSTTTTTTTTTTIITTTTTTTTTNNNNNNNNNANNINNSNNNNNNNKHLYSANTVKFQALVFNVVLN